MVPIWTIPRRIRPAPTELLPDKAKLPDTACSPQRTGNFQLSAAVPTRCGWSQAQPRSGGSVKMRLSPRAASLRQLTNPALPAAPRSPNILREPNNEERSKFTP